MNPYLKNNCYHRRLADLMKISPHAPPRVSHRHAIEGTQFFLRLMREFCEMTSAMSPSPLVAAIQWGMLQ